ncbi:MAG: Rv3235 family protein [Gulosibacter sp.]|uniref:Rv3235 family protein n=1 Tax=Gulosibacter sp. TaxID=2817531 RepID=UPI003F8DC547
MSSQSHSTRSISTAIETVQTPSAADIPAPAKPTLRVVAKTHEEPRKECLGEGVLTGGQVASSLPNPEQLLRNLGRSVFEAMAGVREVEQMARWIAPDVYSGILARAQHAARARRVRGRSMRRPMIETRSCHWQSPRPGVVEATVLIDLGTRVRAVAIRLEVFRGRWRAERLNVL